MAKDKGKARVVVIHVNSGNHWKSKPRLEVRLVWPASWLGCVGPTACPGKRGPLEALPWAWALSCPG
ncbi:unnamed protein product [Prunus armeniaca]